MDNALSAAVDDLLKASATDDEPITGTYDVTFFHKDALEALEAAEQAPPEDDHLADARVGLCLFIEEANAALELSDLTIDQRIHVATIVSYIEGLTTRFDRIRVPGYVQPPRLKIAKGT
jgi:hypothetical protein